MWAYVITVLVTGERWVLHRVLSVVVAIFGVLLIVYGGSPSGPGTQTLPHSSFTSIANLDSPTIRSPHIPPLTPAATRRRTSSFGSLLSNCTESNGTQYTPVPPAFALHPNLITSCMGVCGLLLLWIPIPILHYFNVERWQLPPDGKTWVDIVTLSLCGCVSNGGFMVTFFLRMVMN